MKAILLSIFLFVLFSANTFSLPRFLLKNGGQCIDCHINPTGGNIRSQSGWTFAKNNLGMFSIPKSEDNEDVEMSPKIGKNILFGFDYRTQYLYTDRAPRDSSSRTDFQKMTGSIYTDVELSGKINLFARYDFVWQIWEAYGIVNVLPNNGYIKAGSFTPNFGIRLDDHTAYTRGGDLGVLFATGSRQGLIYEPRYTVTGVELGYNISDFGLFTLSAGNRFTTTFNTDPDYNARLEFTPSIGDFNLLFGGSFAAFRDFQRDQFFNIVQQPVKLYGGFIGFGLGQFTFTGEYDIGKNLVQKDIDASVLMAEASYRITKGLDAVVRYDRYDPNTSISSNELSHVIAGFEFFPYSFIELRPQYRFNTDSRTSTNENAFVLQFHLFY